MNSIPYLKFKTPEIFFFNRNGKVGFVTDVRNLKSKVINHYVYSYHIAGKSAAGAYIVSGSPGWKSTHTVYTRKIGNISQVEWTFTKSLQGEIDLVLSSFEASSRITVSALVSDSANRRDDIIKVMKPLASAANTFGLPLDGKGVTYIYNPQEKKNTQEGQVKKSSPVNTDEKYYRILGIFPTANMGLIEAAYRELTKQNHPDINPNISAERMKKINEAHDYLKKKYFR